MKIKCKGINCVVCGWGGGRVGKIPNIDKSELLVKYTKVFAEGYKCKNIVQDSTSPEAKFFSKI